MKTRILLHSFEELSFSLICRGGGLGTSPVSKSTNQTVGDTRPQKTADVRRWSMQITRHEESGSAPLPEALDRNTLWLHLHRM